MTISKDPNKNWKNNNIQFPRLIAEMEAQGVFEIAGVLEGLSMEMDLTTKEITEIIDRASDEWDKIKEKITGVSL